MEHAALRRRRGGLVREVGLLRRLHRPVRLRAGILRPALLADALPSLPAARAGRDGVQHVCWADVVRLPAIMRDAVRLDGPLERAHLLGPAGHRRRRRARAGRWAGQHVRLP